MASCSAPSGGLRKQIISQLCVLNIDNTSKSLIDFFAKKNQISNEETINHKDEIFKKIKNNASLTQGQTVLGNITKRSSKIFKHLNDNKIKAVFSDIPILNNGIMKKVNEQEREEMIKKISAMTLGMDGLTVRKMFEEVERRNNDEIDPVELAKIKKLIANMFDYNNAYPASASQPGSISSAVNTAIDGIETAGRMLKNPKSEFARQLSRQNPKDMRGRIMKKVATTALQGGNVTDSSKYKSKYKRPHYHRTLKNTRKSKTKTRKKMY